MKLVYITAIQTPSTDAQSVQVAAMSRAFAQHLGFDFVLVSPRNYNNRNISTVWRWERPVVFPFFRSIRYISLIFGSLKTVLQFNPDVVYSRDIGIICVYKMLGRRVVYEMHKPFETRIGSLLMRLVCQYIEFVAISQSLKDYMIKKYHIASNRVCVAHDGVFLSDFTPGIRSVDKKSLGVNVDSLIVMYSGSFQKGKGVDVLLDAAKSMVSQYPHVVFVLLGGASCVGDVPVNVRILPRVQSHEVPSYLALADLLVLLNTSELSYHMYTSPLKLFEYMASGVPILCTSSPSITEVVSEKEVYFLNNFSIGSVTDTIAHILFTKREAGEKASCARKRVQEYDWGDRAKRILLFLDR